MRGSSLTGRHGQNIFCRVQETGPRFVRPILFVVFFISGFCGLLYQVIWTRMAFAAFGIITPVLSVVLSVFMLGLCIGSAVGGKWISVLTRRTGHSAIVYYAIAECMIGVGAFAVPLLFALGGRILLAAGQMNSLGYLLSSACVLALSILPWCFFMGTTFPFMMAYIRELKNHETQSFSFLYAANVLGAMSGTLLTAVVLVELFGFHKTLSYAAAGNFFITVVCLWLGQKQGAPTIVAAATEPALPKVAKSSVTGSPRTRFVQWILFSTGFCAMAMEVVWTRAFTPILKTEVYSFALIVFAYLGATFAGSLLYRYHLKKNSPWPVPTLMAILIVSVFLPIVLNDPRFVKMSWILDRDLRSAIITLASIVPFCAALGYLTPSLIDNYAGDDPKRAGNAYAMNVSGCILGPLVASYFLLPRMNERFALVVLGLPFFVFFMAGWKSLPVLQRLLSSAGAFAILACSLFFSHDFGDYVASHSTRMEVRRDYAASVVSVLDTRGNKSLLVNGIGMTTLTPITKYMVHLPLVLHEGDAKSALIICFGMGTSYRSALSWGLDTTAVELVPDVPNTFGFYHTNAAEVLRNPHGRIIIDDGRRFLTRTTEKYDLIVVDPPPPVEAAGSSLLYSTGMYDLIKQHLKPHGILQIWYPGGELFTTVAVVRSVGNSFPNVRCFSSIKMWGIHILASMDPIDTPTPDQMMARMPEDAKKDLLEWSSSQSPTAGLVKVISQELPLQGILDLNSNSTALITDDGPLNEYFLLRRHGLL
jgi:spermidine synthase